MGDDPFPYGIPRNRKTLETLAGYTHRQGLAPRRRTVEEMFSESTLETYPQTSDGGPLVTPDNLERPSAEGLERGGRARQVSAALRVVPSSTAVNVMLFATSRAGYLVSSGADAWWPRGTLARS